MHGIIKGIEVKQITFYSGIIGYYYTMNYGIILTVLLVQISDVPFRRIITLIMLVSIVIRSNKMQECAGIYLFFLCIYISFIVPPVKLQTISTCNISYIDCGLVEEYSIEYPPFSGSRACTVL